MEVILNDGLGESILLPPSVALDEYEINKQIPGVIMPGKSGQRVYKSLQRIEPVTLRASGTMKFDTKIEADEHASILRSKLFSDNIMWLKRYDGADKFIRVQCNQINHNLHRGHFDGAVYSIDFTFESNDPYWYSTEIKQISEDIVFTPPVTFLNVMNGGEVFVEPVIWIEGKTSGANSTKNPKLVNYSTGDVIELDMVIKENESVIINSESRKSIFVSSKSVLDGYVQNSSESSVQLEANAMTEDGAYTNYIVKIVGGLGAGQYRRIIGYNGATNVAIINYNWETTPDSSSLYEIYHPSWLDGYQLYEAQTFGGAIEENITSKLNKDFKAFGFSLNPGLNRIEVLDDNNLLKIKIMFRERWL